MPLQNVLESVVSPKPGPTWAQVNASCARVIDSRNYITIRAAYRALVNEQSFIVNEYRCLQSAPALTGQKTLLATRAVIAVVCHLYLTGSTSRMLPSTVPLQAPN